MKRLAQGLGGVLFTVVVMLSSVTRSVLADSYSVVNLGNDNGHSIYGIDTAGDVVVWGTSGCGVTSPTCYVTYINGVATSDSATAPVLAYDNGTACGSTPEGFNASKEICNGGWTGLGSLFSPNGDPNGVYFGSGSNLDFILSGSADQVFLNSAGDFAWTDGRDEEMYELIQTSSPDISVLDAAVEPATTPEPRTLLLVGTGLLLATGMIRRKARRYRNLAE
jgi:hypothetical protein